MTDFNFVGTHIPANKTTALVMSKGVQYKPKISRNRKCSENPFGLAKKETIKFLERQSTFKDMTGEKHGTFEVLGLLKGSNSRWVCKCNCGIYETRTAKSIKNHRNNPGKFDLDKCEYCSDIDGLRIEASSRALGMTKVEYCDRFRREVDILRGRIPPRENINCIGGNL